MSGYRQVRRVLVDTLIRFHLATWRRSASWMLCIAAIEWCGYSDFVGGEENVNFGAYQSRYK